MTRRPSAPKRRHQGGDEQVPQDRIRPAFGEIGWQGINSRILSSKKPVMSSKGFQKRVIGA